MTFAHPLPKPIPSSIHGYMLADELAWLYDTAEGLKEAGVQGDLLEVGSYKGLSASALGQSGRLVCVDTFIGGGDLPDHDSFDEFVRAMETMDLHPTVLSGDSKEVLPRLVRGLSRFRLIFLDGSHVYMDVLSDLENSWPMLSTNGILVVDDYVTFPDVKRALDQFVEELSRMLRVDIELVAPGKSKMAWVRKP